MVIVSFAQKEKQVLTTSPFRSPSAEANITDRILINYNIIINLSCKEARRQGVGLLV